MSDLLGWWEKLIYGAEKMTCKQLVRRILRGEKWTLAPRLVSYAPDGSTCTLNINGVEYYYDRVTPNGNS